MLILSILSATIFMGLYYLYTIKKPDNNWYNQFTGSYVFWFNRLPNKAIKWSLLICYIIYWITFLYLSGTYKSISIIYSSILSAIVGFFIIKDTFLNRLHSSVLQISVWTGIIFVLVRCINYWWISILSLLIPFIPYFYNKINKKKIDISGEIITFDVIYLWLAIYTICI